MNAERRVTVASQQESLLGGILSVRLGALLLLLDDAHHLSLDGLLLESEAVLVPDEVRRARIELVSLHAALEQANNVAVVGVLSER